MADDRVTLPPVLVITSFCAFDLSDSLTGLLAILRPAFDLTFESLSSTTLSLTRLGGACSMTCWISLDGAVSSETSFTFSLAQSRLFGGSNRFDGL